MHSTVRTSRWSASSSNGGRVCGVIAVLDPPRTQRERVAHHDPAGRHLPGGDQRVGARLVLTRRGHVGGERGEPEMTGLPVQQGAEHARGVEARDAQPADPAVRRDERARMAVREERVVGDRRERRRRRGALRALGRIGGGGHRPGSSRRRRRPARHHPIRTMAADTAAGAVRAMHVHAGPSADRRRFDGCEAVSLAAGELEATFVPAARDGRRLAAPRRRRADRSPGRGCAPTPSAVPSWASRSSTRGRTAWPGSRTRCTGATCGCRRVRRSSTATSTGCRSTALLAASRYWEVVALDADGDRARLHAALDFGAHAGAHGRVPVPPRGDARGSAHDRAA